MRLIDNWRDVLRRAWSVRIIAIAALFSGLEVALPLIGYTLPISETWRAIVYMLVTMVALVARLLAQNIEAPK